MLIPFHATDFYKYDIQIDKTKNHQVQLLGGYKCDQTYTNHTNFAHVVVHPMRATDFAFSLQPSHGKTVDRNGSLTQTYKKVFIDVISIQSSTVDFV